MLLYDTIKSINIHENLTVPWALNVLERTFLFQRKPPKMPENKIIPQGF